ncbi:MAG: multidrug DMT transporter [Acidithiobacillales bacterium SG8_45]|jgi:drug/metabolite transporter (DMT)-like permease|nr:MAG: multidrug DMT transporter [Acidithiobacillales bacterium SG8_45]
MAVPAAYLAVVILWSTTPLAVKWSGEGPGFLFGVTSRMLLGTVLTLLLLAALRVRVPWHKQAIQTYLFSSLGVFGAMFAVYWSAQYIPSGFISVLFALAPIFTGVLAWVWLGERSLTPGKVFGVLLGIAGLAVMFRSAITLGENGIMGILGLLVAVLLFSISGVGVKRLGSDLHAVAANAGGLIIASAMYLLVWAVFDGKLPTEVPLRALGSIVYLGVLGTTVGFALYMYLLKRLPVATLTLVTLITPATALILGQLLNDEVVGSEVWYGAGLISIGLMVHQFGHRLKLGRVLVD